GKELQTLARPDDFQLACCLARSPAILAILEAYYRADILSPILDDDIIRLQTYSFSLAATIDGGHNNLRCNNGPRNIIVRRIKFLVDGIVIPHGLGISRLAIQGRLAVAIKISLLDLVAPRIISDRSLESTGEVVCSW